MAFETPGAEFVRRRLLLVALLMVGCNVDQDSTSKTSSADSESVSIYVKLATLHSDADPPPAGLVADYRAALTKLAKKCPKNTHDQLANYAYFMRKKLAEIGHEHTTLECIGLMDESIPEGQTLAQCDEIAAALIALTKPK